ncbi:MAG: guanylate kinase [Coriobacteriia bacterium]|nr:guanylate kinase [Coriobacteriia bacterium]
MAASVSVPASASAARRGHLYVFSGPSGTGKGTVLAALCGRNPELWFSVSATTRAPRAGEADGRDYHFVSRKRFEELIATDGLLEWARVFDQYYGTPRAPVAEQVAAGVDCLLDIDVQGALQVRERMPEAVLIFLKPPSLEALRARLTQRGTEDPAEIERRLAAAADEMAHESVYNHILVNVTVDETVARINDILVAHRLKE